MQLTFFNPFSTLDATNVRKVTRVSQSSQLQCLCSEAKNLQTMITKPQKLEWGMGTCLEQCVAYQSELYMGRYNTIIYNSDSLSTIDIATLFSSSCANSWSFGISAIKSSVSLVSNPDLPSTLQEERGSGEYSTTFTYLWQNFGGTIRLADVAIISPLLGFLTAYHSALLITPLQTYLALPIY